MSTSDWSELCGRVYAEPWLKYTALISALLRSCWPRLLEVKAIFTTVPADLIKVVKEFVNGDEGDGVET